METSSGPLLDALYSIFEPMQEGPAPGPEVLVRATLQDSVSAGHNLPPSVFRAISPFLPVGAIADVFEFRADDLVGAAFSSADTLLVAVLAKRRIDCHVFRKASHTNALPAISAVIWPLLREVWLRGGRLMLHAAAALIDGGAILMLADSGGGKSTSSLALARGGAQFLSDDISLISTGSDDRILVEGIRELVKVTAGTIAFFPELEPFRAHLEQGSPKVAVPIEKLFGNGSVAVSGPLAAVFQLHLSDRGPRVSPLPGADAVAALLRAQHIYRGQSIDRAAFEMIHRVAETIPCYALETGPDPTRLYDALKSCL